MRRRNTAAFTFAAWAFFVLSIIAEYVGIYNLDEPLAVKGYYAVTGLCLLMSAIVLQKTVRDNQEDADEAARHAE